jgi:hypothetical protein
MTISAGGGNFPEWSRTANELFYRTEDHRLIVTPYTVTRDERLIRCRQASAVV